MFQEGVERSVDTLAASSGRVIYIGDPPATTDTGRTCLTERDATLEKCMFGPDPLVLDFIAAARTGAESQGADYIDPAAWFCVADQCPAVVGNFVTRRDKAHITVDYAAQLTPALDDALQLDDPTG